jgi:hypothetical protein
VSAAPELDYWEHRRTTARVLLEQLEAVIESVSCQRVGCPAMADVRAAIDTIDSWIDRMPVDCDHLGAG